MPVVNLCVCQLQRCHCLQNRFVVARDELKKSICFVVRLNVHPVIFFPFSGKWKGGGVGAKNNRKMKIARHLAWVSKLSIRDLKQRCDKTFPIRRTWFKFGFTHVMRINSELLKGFPGITMLSRKLYKFKLSLEIPPYTTHDNQNKGTIQYQLPTGCHSFWCQIWYFFITHSIASQDFGKYPLNLN